MNVIKPFLNFVDSLDNSIGKYIYKTNFYYLDDIVYIGAYAFNPPPIILYLSFAFYKYGLEMFLNLLIPVLTGLIFCLTTKKFFGRLRPTNLFNRRYNFRAHENNCSMPSGDSFQAALWATLLSIYFHNGHGIYFVPFVMFSRVYYHCHFISDTIVGAICGHFWAIMIHSLNLDKIILSIIN